MQRVDRLRREAYAGDLDLACISEAIALSAIEGRMRDARFRDEYRSVARQVGVEGQRGINTMSAREAVRRKIKKLIELGVILQVGPAEYVMKPGFLQQDSVQARLPQALVDTTRFINDSLDQGLFLAEEA